MKARVRRVRTVLIWMALCFVGVQFAVAWLVDHDWRLVRFGGARSLLAKMKEQDGPRVVCLGSSRAAQAIDDLRATVRLRSMTRDDKVQVFNAAVGVGDLHVCDFMLDQMLRQKTRPEMVVVEVMPENLCWRNKWLSVHVIRHFTWRDDLRDFLELTRSNGLMRVLSKRFVPIYQFREQLCREACSHLPREWTADNTPVPAAAEPVATHPVAEQAPKAAEKPTPHPGDSPDEAAIRASFVPHELYWKQWLANYAIGGGSASAFERLLGRCRDNHIPVILVAVPISKVHREQYTSQIEVEYRQYLARVAGDCKFFDMRSRIPDGLFRDHHHLNAAGMQKFTKLLVEEILAAEWYQHRIADTLATRSR